MFTVYCDGTCIFDPRLEDLALISPKVSLELNKAGSFTFTIPPEHPYYDLPQKVASKIIVYWDDDAIFYGRPVVESIDFWNRKSIECEGELAYLNDTIQRPGEYHSYTVRQYLEMLIANHNEQVSEDKQFTVGIVTVEDENDSLYRYTNYNSTMEEAKADLVDDLGGYLKVRNEDGYRYLDYLNLDDYGDTSSQTIEFGENLLDFARNVDMSDIATAIIPLGETLDESDIEALDAHLTIELVNDGSDCIQDDEAVEKYGFICKVVEWSDITTAEYLLSKATKYLANYAYDDMIIEASAVDMHLTDDDVMRLKLGDKVRVVSEPHGVDDWYYISAMTYALDSPSSTTVTLGVDESESLTAQTVSISTAAEENKVNKSGILASAVAQATALITEATHGYIVINDTDGDGEPDELLIMDTDDMDTATRVWRWNLNGLGYSSTGYDGEYGVAITMDGQIVGTYIAAGTIGAEQLTVEYLASVEEEISNSVLEAKDYTDDELTNYYTQTEVTQLFTVNNATLLSEISETYTATAIYNVGIEVPYARWSFDAANENTDGTIYFDEDNDAYLLTTIAGTPTVENGAAVFDGTQFLAAPLEMWNGDLTISVWVTVSSLSADAYILQSRTEADTGLTVMVSSDSSFVLHYGGLTWSTYTGYVELDTLYHLAYTVDWSEDTIKCYLNGNLIATSTDELSSQDYASYIWVGSSGETDTYPTAVSGGFTGTLDDLRIYDRKLTPDEVAAVYAQDREMSYDPYVATHATTAKVSSLISQTYDTIILEVSQTYATQTEVGELSTTITETAEGLTLEITRATQAETDLEDGIEETQTNARTYFAADATSITVSTGVITFESDTIAITSDYFTLTADGHITATSVTLSGFFRTENDDYWIEIDDGKITGGVSGSSTIQMYMCVDAWEDSTLDYIGIGGKSGIVFRTPYIAVGDYAAPGVTGSTVYACKTDEVDVLIELSTTSQGFVTAVGSTSTSVITSLSGTSRTFVTGSSSLGTFYLPTALTSDSSGGYRISSYTYCYNTPYNCSYVTLTPYSSANTSTIYHLSSSTAVTTTYMSRITGATSQSMIFKKGFYLG